MEQRLSHCIQTAQINNMTLLATRLPTARIEAVRARVGGFPFELVVSEPVAKDRWQSTGRSCREKSDFNGDICRLTHKTVVEPAVRCFNCASRPRR